MLCKARAAINGPVVLRLERDLGGCTALGADGVIHNALAPCGVLAIGPAGLAASGLILEALLGIKLLLAGGEYELGAAILANQYLVFEHVGKNPLKSIFDLGGG